MPEPESTSCFQPVVPSASGSINLSRYMYFVYLVELCRHSVIRQVCISLCLAASYVVYLGMHVCTCSTVLVLELLSGAYRFLLWS